VEASPPRRREASPPTRRRAASPSPSPPRRAPRGDRSPSPGDRRREVELHSYDRNRDGRTAAPFESLYNPKEVSSPWPSYRGSTAYKLSRINTSVFERFYNTAFDRSLQPTERMLERSRSRTRDRNRAMRSHRSTSTHYSSLMNSYVAPSVPIRNREFSTPSSLGPSRSGSYISLANYASGNSYDLGRSESRGSLYDSRPTSGLSYSSSGNLYGAGSGLARADSFVSAYDDHYDDGYSSNYVGNLERTVQYERQQKDRLKHAYIDVSRQLEQACKQMDMLNAARYGSRNSSLTRSYMY
jgi:hypothetical protein